MKRTFTTIVAVAVMAFATSAGAKGPSKFTVTGAGLDAPVEIEPGPNLGAILASTRLFEDPAVDRRAPSGVPGPCLKLTWSVPIGARYDEVGRLVQHLYLYARGGPLIYTPPGQSMYGRAMRTGWHRADDRLVGQLRGLGIPDRATLRSGDDPCARRAAQRQARRRPRRRRRRRALS